MSKIFVCAVLLACVLPARAETWNFQYQGFHDSASGAFLADKKITGSFIGSDLNKDGAVGLAEITSFVLNGFDYIACGSQSNAQWHCGTQAFSYSGGKLSFIAGMSAGDPETWVGGGHFFAAGDREYRYDFRPGEFNEWEYRWTAQTTFAITPVPEPAAWLSLLAGLPLAVRAARRRKK